MKSPRQILASFLHPTQPLTQRLIGRPGIRAWEALAYTLAFALAVVTVGAFLRWHIASLHGQEMASWRARQFSVADDRAQRLSDWLADRQLLAQLLATRPSIRAALRASYDAGQLSKHPPGGLPEMTAALDEMATLYSYTRIYVLDRDAHVVAQSSDSPALGPLLAENCRPVAHTGVVRINLLGDAPDRSLISFTAPVFPGPGTSDAGRPPGQLLGIVLVVSDASQTLFPLVTRKVVPARTGETLLVRREGNDMVYFSPLRHVPAGSQDLRFPLSTAPAPARLALEGRETFVEYRDYRGVLVLAATQHIALTGWGLVRKIDRAEAMEHFRRMAIAEGLAAGLLIILLGGLLLFHRRDVMTRVLKREEEKFRALLESAPDAIYIIEPSTLRILGRNRKAAQMDGYSDQDIAHMSATGLHPPEDHALPREWFERGSGADGVLCLHAVQRKDGQLVPVEESQTLVDAGGERLILSIVRDITERKRAEETLRESETRYRTLVENIPQSIFMKSRDYRWVSVNKNFARSLGVRPEDIVGKVDYDLFPKGLADKYHADDKRIMETGVTDEFDEEYMERNEGRIVHTIKTPVRDESGTVIGLLGVFWDVTERKRAEEALRESGERTRIVAESVTDVIYEWDLRDKVEWYGDVDSLMGYPAGGFPRTIGGWAAALHPEDKERVWLAIESQLKGLAPYNVDYRVAGKDGGWRWWSARGTVLRDEQGQPRRWVGAITDITERKRAEIEIRKLNDDLEQRVAQRTAELEATNSELEAFTYSVSHDLRAPLRHIDGFSRLLVEEHGAELSPGAQEYVATIRDSVLQMGILIDDLLNLARVGRKQLVMQVTGLNSLVDEVRTELNRANPDRVIEWKVETLPFVECDPALIKQVFANLLSNAVKFTRPRKPAVIEVGAIRQDDHPVVFVRDNGVGFSMKYANKLFGVFQRLHRAEDFEGTGVGLATVQRIIHKHRGRVWSEAELDKGATFYFTLGSPDDPAAGKASSGSI
jgi:PAS domain S-box-containing protein